MKDLDIYIALVHYPVLNKKGETVTTSITNLDVHDIARMAKTIGIKEYYLISPIKEQIALLERITSHWKKYEKLKTTDRANALSSVYGISSLEILVDRLKKQTNKDLVIVSTSAKSYENNLKIKDFAKKLSTNKAYLLLFGTGWGLDNTIIQQSDIVLEPIEYKTGFNHLSVRSAVSIILDRISCVLDDKDKPIHREVL